LRFEHLQGQTVPTSTQIEPAIHLALLETNQYYQLLISLSTLGILILNYDSSH
jgi:hypothetical protein